MFITIKGEKDEKLLVNTSQIKFIAPRTLKGEVVGCFIDFGAEIYIRSNSTIAEIKQMIAESEGTE